MSNHHQRSGAAVAYFQSSSIFQSSMSSAGGIIEAAVSYSTTQRNKTGIKKLKEYVGVKGLQVDLSVNSDGTDITFNLMNEYAKYLVQYKKSDGEYLSHGSLGNYLDGLRAYIQSLKNISDSHWIHNRDRYKRIKTAALTACLRRANQAGKKAKQPHTSFTKNDLEVLTLNAYVIGTRENGHTLSLRLNN